MLDGKNAYSPKDVATWLDDLRDYLSGRTPELDQHFSWCEPQPAEIVKATEYNGFLDCAAPEVSAHEGLLLQKAKEQICFKHRDEMSVNIVIDNTHQFQDNNSLIIISQF